MNRPLFQLAIWQLKEFIRRPDVLFWALTFPVLMVWILGLAFNKQGENIYRIAVVNVVKKNLNELCLSPSKAHDTTRKLAEVSELRTHVKRIQCEIVETPADAYRLIRQGKALLLMEVREQDVKIHFDPQNSEAEKTYFLLKSLLTSIFSPQLKVSQVKVQKQIMRSKGNRYIDFLVPGLIALSILNGCFRGAGWSLIELRMKRLLRQMIATPMSKFDFMLSFVLVRILVGSIEFALLYGFAHYYFGVIIQGSLVGLFLVFTVGVVSFTGMAILTASRPNNTRVGDGVINAVILPMTIFSGVFFSYHNLPEVAVFIIKLMPLTTLVDTIRAIFNEGMGFFEVLQPTALLLVEGIVSLILGIKFFRWQ